LLAPVLIEEARRGYPSIANDDYTSVITERHQARLNAAIEEAAAAGAVIISHGGEHAGTRKIGAALGQARGPGHAFSAAAWLIPGPDGLAEIPLQPLVSRPEAVIGE
jgi:hypothetical protein